MTRAITYVVTCDCGWTSGPLPHDAAMRASATHRCTTPTEETQPC